MIFNVTMSLKFRMNQEMREIYKSSGKRTNIPFHNINEQKILKPRKVYFVHPLRLYTGTALSIIYAEI